MQTTLVFITFTLALAYFIKKIIWDAFFESKQKSAGTLDGGNTKCGKNDCGCH